MAFVLRTELPRHGISVCEYNGSLVQRPYGGVQVPTGDKVFRGPARARPRAFMGMTCTALFSRHIVERGAEVARACVQTPTLNARL